MPLEQVVPSWSGETRGLQKHIILQLGDLRLHLTWMTPLWREVAPCVQALDSFNGIAPAEEEK